MVGAVGLVSGQALCSSVPLLVLQGTIVQYNISLIISVSSSHIEIGESWLLGKDRDKKGFNWSEPIAPIRRLL